MTTIYLISGLAPTSLAHRSRVGTCAEHGVRARERLGACSNARQILAGRQPLVAGQVRDEVLQVAAEVGLRARRDEAEDGLHAVAAAVQLPTHAADRWRGDRAARGGDGARAAQRVEPDHDLVL